MKRQTKSVDGRGAGGGSEEDVDLGEVLEFIRLLWQVDHGLQSISKRMKGELGVTGPQRFTLRMIGRKPGISAGALASMLHLDPSTLTGVLQRLEKRGAIKRVSDRDDRRRSLFELTPKGKVLDAVRTRTVEAAVRRALASVPSADVECAKKLINALVAELENEARA